MKFSSEAEDVV